jgi:hypothetical protein
MSAFTDLVLTVLRDGVFSQEKTYRAVGAISFAYVACGFPKEDAWKFFEALLALPENRPRRRAKQVREDLWIAWARSQDDLWIKVKYGDLVPGRMQDVRVKMRIVEILASVKPEKPAGMTNDDLRREFPELAKIANFGEPFSKFLRRKQA